MLLVSRDGVQLSRFIHVIAEVFCHLMEAETDATAGKCFNGRQFNKSNTIGTIVNNRLRSDD